MPEAEQRCSICGETDPMPSSMCLAKLAGCAEPDKPCQYSVEGCERLRVYLARLSEAPSERPTEAGL